VVKLSVKNQNQIGRGDCPSFELVQDVLAPFFDVFTGPPEPFVLAGARLARRSA